MSDNPKKQQMLKPSTGLGDRIARWLRKNAIVQALSSFLGEKVIPILFVIFVVAPIGSVMALFFIPKFIRNAQRRSKYAARLVPSGSPIERIKRTGSEGAGTA
jgi:hypothetical protein